MSSLINDLDKLTSKELQPRTPSMGLENRSTQMSVYLSTYLAFKRRTFQHDDNMQYVVCPAYNMTFADPPINLLQ